MMVILITLCLVSLAAVGPAAAAAPDKLPPPYRTVQFSVNSSGNIVGTLTINTNQWKYVLNAEGLQPGTEYFFSCRGRFPYIGNTSTNKDGALHLQGPWDPQITDITGDPSFVLTTRPLLGSGCVQPRLASEYLDAFFWAKIWGSLTTPEGSPLPGQTLGIEKSSYDYWTDTYSWSPWRETVTGADGTFEMNGDIGYAPKVVYDGGVYNGTTYCSAWVIAAKSNKVPL
jgi:hypothetical protein